MASTSKILEHIRLDEKTHVEEPFLQQLETMPGLHWNVMRLDKSQTPKDTQREDFAEVLMKKDLSEAIKRINPWLEDDQVFEAASQLDSFETDNLLKNNQRVLDLLLNGTPVGENRKTGEKNAYVNFIDFTNLSNNTFVAVSQFKVRILGTDHHIYPDIICFLNGLPISVIECKSPRTKEPIPEAIDQLMRYCEQRNYAKEGSRKLIYYNQFIVATCRSTAKFGTFTTTIEKLFFRWTDPFPSTLDDLSAYCNPQYFVSPDGEEENALPETRTSPNDQQRLVHGMLSPENLLSIIRSFSIISTDSKGNLIKVVGRYQQFRAVKLTVKRLLEGQNKKDRSGIIWHTQGSGKSLTMVFLIREMYLYSRLQSYKIVLLTDRVQLDDQIKGTARSVGYTINDPDTISDLKEALRTNTSEIVSAMIHKFQERDLTSSFPELNPLENVLILTDEAHRSQYSLLGANLDRALPNATRLAFTGTPIDKTELVFGDYIDKYTMRQSIKDGVTLEIVYEGRTHEAEVTDTSGANKKFEDVFKDYSLGEKTEILAYGTRKAYLEAKETIVEKAKDMLDHYVQHVFPNGYKAQVVSVSKEAAHRYKVALEDAKKTLISELRQNNPNRIDLGRLESLRVEAVISDVDHNDAPHLKAYSDSKARKLAIAGFKLPFGKQDKVDQERVADGNIGILVVVDMLLTGFDAPIEQVMYLDKVVINHNLLQAIARVNRVYDDDKKVGFVVDYVGMGNHLKKALDAYWEKEQQEIVDCLADESQLFADLAQAHRSLLRVFEEKGLSGYSDPDDIFNLFYDENIRYSFLEAYDKFAKALDNVFPRRQALDYIKDLNRFTEIKVLASQHFRDQRLTMKGVSGKLRGITDEYLKSRGIKTKVEAISILDEHFFEHVKTRKTTKTQAAEVEHAIRHFIDVNDMEDPELYASFAEELNKILTEFRDNWDEIYKLLEGLRQRIRTAQQEPTYGLHRKKQIPFFRILKKEFYGDKSPISDDEVSTLVACTKEIFERITLEIAATGFWQNIPSINRLRGEIANHLALEYHAIPNVFNNRAHIANRILELAKSKHDTILFAE